MTDFIAQLRGLFFSHLCKYFKKNVSVGPNLRIYKRLAIRGSGKVEIGANCVIRGVQGDSSQYVCLDTHSSASEIVIGDNARLCAARLFAKFSINIGDDFHIEESGVSDTDFHSIDVSRGEPLDETPEKCQIVIGDSVYIGSRSFICKGVKIGNQAIVWPGSIVSAPVPQGASVCGNPARPIKK